MQGSFHNKAPEIAAKGLIASYESSPDDPVLQDIDIDLRGGEVVAVVGPNGSGKSTLIRTLSRTLRPTGGVVLLDERDLYRETTSRMAALRIGVVPQETAVAFDFTVREIVAMGRAPHQAPLWLSSAESATDRAAIDEALRQADIPAAFADRPISTLSGGERQRVLIARAIAQEAKVLLLDEPTSALDLRHQGELLAWLGSLARLQGRVVFAAMHDLNLAARHADRIVVLDGGRIVACGTPELALRQEVIEDVYGVRVRVQHDPITGRPYFLTEAYHPEPFEKGPLSGVSVHVICGAGSGRALLESLLAAGAHVTVGALHEGDSDLLAVQGLPSAQVCVAPAFVRLTEENLISVLDMGGRADYTLVSAVPFGEMNMANLQAACRLAEMGKPIIIDCCATSSSESVELELARLRSHSCVRSQNDPFALLLSTLSSVWETLPGA